MCQKRRASEPLMGHRFTEKTGGFGNPSILDQMLQIGLASDRARVKANVVTKETLGIHLHILSALGRSQRK